MDPDAPSSADNTHPPCFEIFDELTNRSVRDRRIPADFARQINQRNDDGKCADELADCANLFPIHGINLTKKQGRPDDDMCADGFRRDAELEHS